MTRRPPAKFHLKQNERLLGLVHIIGIGEMFWYQVRFEPTASFDEVAPLFDKAIQALDYDGPDDPDDFHEIWDEIIASGVVLVRDDDHTVIDCFILHLDGENSHLRYVEPSELES